MTKRFCARNVIHIICYAKWILRARARNNVVAFNEEIFEKARPPSLNKDYARACLEVVI